MRSKRSKTDPYRRLRRVLFLRGMAITALAAGAVLLIRWLTRGHLADPIVSLIRLVTGKGYYEARDLYWSLFSGNMEVLIALAILLFALLLFWMLLRAYTRYFDQVVSGIDRLTKRDGQEIVLDRELDFVQRELNAVRQTLERQEREAHRIEQEKNDMVVYLAHDIRTPLTSVLGYMSLLDENPGLDEGQRRRYIRLVLDKARRLETLVNEFFEITRYELQNVPLEKESLSARWLLEQLADELYPLLKSGGKTLELSVDDSVRLLGDGEKLARAFGNLLKNAASYGEAGSPIRVSAEQEGARCVLRFENRGEIPQDMLETVFEKFRRLDSARSGDGAGAGLGLTIARDIIRLHGGDLRADSRDGLTVFTVELPVPQS